MNYLAHMYLSGEEDGIKIGNFIGDYVKGRDYENYPELIRKGILLHRGIDDFTDKHPIVRNAKVIFQENYRKYSGIIVDVIFDHYLAINWEKFSSEPLLQFIHGIHELLKANIDILPLEVQRFVPSFIEKNWMRAYQTLEGIEAVLNRMSMRTSLPDNSRSAIENIQANYQQFDDNFSEYFPQLIEYVKKEFGINLIY
ncbi:MAG: DUF479 domain-containing protein [Bacteroidales bacterium]|nr:DUF479 domain-containing protein [Bacteroidales bacterium]